MKYRKIINLTEKKDTPKKPQGGEVAKQSDYKLQDPWFKSNFEVQI